MIKVVFDANIWISAFGAPGRVRSLLGPARLERFAVVVSPEILEETIRILRGPKFRLAPEVLEAVEYEIGELARMVYPIENLKVVKDDPDDDRVLECAVEGAAEIIVSGDKHLLKLGAFRGIRILAPTAFLDELERQEGAEGWGGGAGREEPPILREARAEYGVRTGGKSKIQARNPRRKLKKRKP